MVKCSVGAWEGREGAMTTPQDEEEMDLERRKWNRRRREREEEKMRNENRGRKESRLSRASVCKGDKWKERYGVEKGDGRLKVE